MLFSVLFSILIAGTDLPHPAASESMIDSFIAGLPPSKRPASDQPSAIDKQALEQLEQANAGREADVRQVFATYRQCKQDSKKRAVSEALRSTARRLGDEKLARLTAFYQGEDHARFGRLSSQPESELSKAETAEMERILAAYPLEDFFKSSKQTEQEMWSTDGLLGALIKCQEAFDAELARQGLES